MAKKSNKLPVETLKPDDGHAEERPHGRSQGHAQQRHLPALRQPTSGRIAAKVINHLGDEVMKVFRVE